MKIQSISRERIKSLAKLSRKQERLEKGQVIVEGARILDQLASNNIMPLELYLEGEHQAPSNLQSVPCYRLLRGDMERICETNHAQGISALFPLPRPREASLQRALYLDGISDPGNMGTIFRIAAAFGISSILLAENCVEISNPKVIRASLGSVYWVPFRTMNHKLLLEQTASLIALDMDGEIGLKDFTAPQGNSIYLIGSEAHGITRELRDKAGISIRIEMQSSMESLNAAIATALLAHRIFVSN